MKKLIAILAAVAALAFPAMVGAAVKSNGTTVPVKVKCKKQAGGGDGGGIYGSVKCTGSLRLQATIGGKTVSVGQGKISVPDGKSKAVIVRLTPAGRQALAQMGSLKVRVFLKTSSPAKAAKKLTISKK